MEDWLKEQLKEFENAPETERASFWEKKFNAQELVGRFLKLGIPVDEIEIDVKDFERWMKEYPSVVECYSGMGEARIEKILEHYLTLRYLDVRPTDVLIDVGAQASVFAQTLRMKGMIAYRQDLRYSPGINGYNIGGDAGNMPVPDGFANVLTLHCAYECFQGDADVKFAREAGRILQKNGRLGIIPLYIDTIHFVKTSPWCNKRDIKGKVESGAKWLWRDDKHHEPFSRHYSPEVFAERIIPQMPEMEKKLLFFTNLKELSEYYEGQRIYCYFMFRGQKTS